MRTFHFLDAVCLFVVAAFILHETDAQPKKPNTKLKNKGPTNSGNAKPNAGLISENRWDLAACDEGGLKLSGTDQLTVEYIGQYTGTRSVTAKQPISKKDSGFFYYEVEILAREGHSISIGLGPTKCIPTGKGIGINEGYAYSNNGDIWGHKVVGSCDFMGRPYIRGQPQFAVRDADSGDVVVGDVVGCGVNFAKRQIFYTLNGTLLKTPDLRAADLDAVLFPTVSLDYPGNKIKANFGSEKFKFDIAKAFRE